MYKVACPGEPLCLPWSRQVGIVGGQRNDIVEIVDANGFDRKTLMSTPSPCMASGADELV